MDFNGLEGASNYFWNGDGMEYCVFSTQLHPVNFTRSTHAETVDLKVSV